MILQYHYCVFSMKYNHSRRVIFHLFFFSVFKLSERWVVFSVLLGCFAFIVLFLYVCCSIHETFLISTSFPIFWIWDWKIYYVILYSCIYLLVASKVLFKKMLVVLFLVLVKKLICEKVISWWWRRQCYSTILFAYYMYVCSV